jgi:periplasmic divalent cation tolerance protein
MTEFIVVYVMASSAAEGERIAATLVEERLAACVNCVDGVQSVYRWEGKVERNRESLLIVKTRADLLSRLANRVRELHSYTVPEVIALPILQGDQGYLQWLAEQLRKCDP